MAPILVDKEKKKRDIAAGALEAFLKLGFARTSMNQVAKHIGVGKGTIYDYFKSKDDLVIAAFEVAMEGSHADNEAFAPIMAIENPMERLRAFSVTVLETYLNSRESMQIGIIMFQLMVEQPERFKHLQIIQRMFAPIRQFFVDTLLEGVEKGIFRKDVAERAEKIAINIVAFEDGLLLHKFLDPDYFDLREQVNQFMDNLYLSLRSETVEGGIINWI